MSDKPSQCPYCKVRFTNTLDCPGRSYPKIICHNCRNYYQAKKMDDEVALMQMLFDKYRQVPVNMVDKFIEELKEEIAQQTKNNQ